MGFYGNNDSERWAKERKDLTVNGLKWVAAIVLSASVGSATTFAVVPHLKGMHWVAGNSISLTGSARMSAPTASATGKTPSVSMTSLSTQVNPADNPVTRVFKEVEPDVMAVVNYGRVTDYFSQTSQLQPVGVGTGVLFYKNSKYGYVVTNNHVVEGAAEVQTVLSSGKHVKAQVVGTDPYTDLAVIKIPASVVQNVSPVTFANSNTIEPGERAIAIGTPMGLDFRDSVTAGIVSAKSRMMPVEDPQSQQTLDYQAVIQTDAAINPGNSGGPLLNIDGQVMGINSSKIVAQGFQGMGFAIPTNEVQNIAAQIMKTGHATHPSVGITGDSLTSLPQFDWPNVPVQYGVWIHSVTSASARDAGLKPNDVIVSLDGKLVKNIADLRTYLFQCKPGQTVTLGIYRSSQKMTIKLVLGKMASPNTTSQASPSGQNYQGLPYDPLNPFGGGQFAN